MCGISGIVSADGIRRYHLSFLEEVVKAQERRGPDHHAIQVVRDLRPGVAFGHNRLSIIDVSDAANQPFWSDDKQFCVTFNGEIYNYKELREELQGKGRIFRTNSDTEVLVEAWAEWGSGAVERFNGMFAFGIVNVRTGEFYLVRDRFGVKPLHYAFSPAGELYFASTATSIANFLDLPPNREYLADGIQWLVYEDGSARTQFEDLNSVEPGTCISFVLRDGKLNSTKRRYYDLAARVRQKVEELEGQDETALIRLVEDVFTDAIRLRLRSDVPVGISLSGGMDSSLVACIANQMDKNVAGITFGHPDQPSSEGKKVREIEKHLKIDVEYIWPTPAEMEEAIWRNFEAQEAPFPNFSGGAQNLVFATARKRGFRVMLGGQGADECFMGYRKYLYMTLLRRDKPGGILSDALGFSQVAIKEMSRIAQNLTDGSRYFRAPRMAVNLPTKSRRLGMKDLRHIRDRQIEDVLELSIPTLLRYEDHNSMGSSIESRLPFLDYRLAEIGLALPNRLKVRKGLTKWVLRQISRKYLPPSIWDSRLKIGFEARSTDWTEEGLGDHIRTSLKDAFEMRLIDEPPTPNGHFSNQNLSQYGLAFCEAMTAIWLSRRTLRTHAEALSQGESPYAFASDEPGQEIN